MKLTFLGTGAADWIKPLKDGEFRRYTSTLINHDLLIDATFSIMDMLPPWAEIEHILITHSHRDHFELAAMEAISRARINQGKTPISLHIETGWASDITSPLLHVQPFSPFTPFTIGQYTVLPLPANHRTERANETPVHFLISQGDHRLLYATDGAWMLLPSVQALGNTPLSALIIDATIGDGHIGDYRIFEHNSLPMVRIMVDTLRHTWRLPEGAPVYLTHMARTLHPPHKELEASLAPPLVAAYDGLSITL